MATSTLGSGTVVLAGTTSGTTTVTATAVAGTTTLTLPAATDTLVGKATTDTLTNKTLTSATLTGVVTFDAGTAAAPAITTTGDTNTGIFFPAADTIAFSEGGAEAMRIDSSGNVGIGTTSPLNKLDARAASAVIANYQTIQAFSTDSAAIDLGGGIGLGGFYSTTSAIAVFGNIVGRKENATGGNFSGYLAFGTNNNSTGIVERMRIDSSGNIIYTQPSLACYVWTAFNPTNTSGTITNAPATGTAYDTGFVTMVNSSGTLTITFDIAGKYLVSTNLQTSHANTYTNERSTFTLGGTATAATGTQNPSFSGIDSVDANTTGTYPIYVSATAAQTTTILPTYELTGSGTTAQHTCRPSVTVQYCGG